MKRIGKPRVRRWSTDRLIRLALAYGSTHRGWAAVALLHRRGSPQMLAHILALARSPSARRRVLAMDIAAQLRCPGHVHDYESEPYALEETQAVLIDGLDDRHLRVLQAAITGLGHRAATAALPALLGHLDNADSGVRFALAFTLSSYPEPAAIEALMRLATDRDDDVRDWATFGLGAVSEADGEEIRALLWANAHDPNRDVRGEAVVGLARRSDTRVIELLKTRLLDDDCRVYELEAAEEMPRPELLEPLQRLRDDVERLHDIDPTWHRHLLDAIDACELVADATP